MSATDRWAAYTDLTPTVAAGWSLTTVTPPSRLGGSNGITVGPDGRLYVTQVFFSQVTAIDVDTGEHSVFSPLGSGIRGPDDGIFGADGTFYATEPMFGRVTALAPDGTYRVVAADLPGANGVTMDAARQRLFVDEFRPGGRLMELDPTGSAPPRFLLDGLAGPNAPAVGPDGRLWFPQVFADQVWWYDLDSGESRLAVDDLARPTAIKFDSRGRLVVAEAAAGRITAVDITTGERTTLAEVPLGIDNLALGPDDRLFVAHYVDGRVAEETGGRSRMLSEPGLLGPHGLAVGPDGTILFADGLSAGSVRGGTAERSVRLLVDLPTLAIGIAPSDGGLAVLGAGGEVLLYGPSGGEPRTLATGLVDPTCLRADGDGFLATERRAGRVVRLDAGGAASTLLDGVAGAAAVDRLGDGFAVAAGSAVVVVDGAGSERRIDGFGDAQGIAVLGDVVVVADAQRHELVAIDLASGRRDVAVERRARGLAGRRRGAGGVRPAGRRRSRRRAGRVQRRRVDPHPDAALTRRPRPDDQAVSARPVLTSTPSW